MLDASLSSTESVTSCYSLCSLAPCFADRFGAQWIERVRQCKLRIGSTNKKINFVCTR